MSSMQIIIINKYYNYFKHAWVISLNKASHHIKIKCENIIVIFLKAFEIALKFSKGI